MSQKHQSNYQRNQSRESQPSRRSSQQSSSSFNGGGNTHLRSNMPAATMRNSISPTAVTDLADDLSHLNLPNGDTLIGATVQCVPVNGPILKGEVMAFDQQHKALVLKSSSTCNRFDRNDVHIMNLSHFREVKILSESKKPVPELPSLNLEKLKKRQQEEVERKQRMVMAYRSGIPVEGQRLFQAISKTLSEITWNGESIQVMTEVTIAPPYGIENVLGKQDSQMFKHVQKIVEKHINDELVLKQQTETKPASDQAVHNNNNSKANESNQQQNHQATTQQASVPSPSHQQVTRNSSGRYDDGGSGAGGGGGGGKSSSGGGRSQRQGGGGRNSNQKRDFDAAKTFTHSRCYRKTRQ